MSSETLTSKIITSLPNFTNMLYSNVNKNQLANDEILKIGNALEGILSNMDNDISIDIPKLVVVGTQSSGKSSLLNNIISMDIMPTGKTMVTRVPLNIQLNLSKSSKAEFGDYISGKWVASKEITLTHPTPLKEEIIQIHNEIEEQTKLKAGTTMNINNSSIILKIYSPNVPNLGLVDLPGLVMVACTDKGQPKDIKEQIKSMIGSYISNERSTILAVIPARPDIEADPALELIKEYDPMGKRTIGILTKIDLMNKGTDVSDYLNNNNISKDLQFKYGYYAVKNRSTDELNTISVDEGITNEQNYFKSHSIYGKLKCQEKLGIYNLTKSLNEILVNQIRKNIPNIMSEITKNLKRVNDELLSFGMSIPTSNEGLLSLLYSFLTTFCKEFSKSINDRDYDNSTGRKIKEILIKYRKEIQDINCFNYNTYSDSFIENMIENYSGNHMFSNIFPIEIIESCLRNPNKESFELVLNPSLNCLNSIKDLLIELMEDLLKNSNINNFPKLKQKINEELLLAIQNNFFTTEKKIKDFIVVEKNYIWTDNSKFIDSVETFLKNTTIDNSNPDHIRQLLTSYYSTFIETASNTIPKIIMFYTVKESTKEINENLFEKISKCNINEMLKENDEIASKREKLISYREKLSSSYDILKTV